MNQKTQQIRELCKSCSGNDQDETRLYSLIIQKKLTDEWFSKVKRLFDGVKKLTTPKESRFVLMYEWIILDIYGKPNKIEQRLIDNHLQAIRKATTNLGIDSTEKEKEIFKKLETHHLNKIKAIHEGYYLSIKCQNYE